MNYLLYIWTIVTSCEHLLCATTKVGPLSKTDHHILITAFVDDETEAEKGQVAWPRIHRLKFNF